MKIIVFGLSISSSWGNGHATLLRGLFRALHGAGHEVHFFEKDVPYYAAHRDAAQFSFAELHLYSEFSSVAAPARKLLDEADAGLVTSYCPDGAAASELVLASRSTRKLFYDMDTPVTLLKLQQGEKVPYLPEHGLGGFDLVLSYTGGEALTALRERLGARRAEALYGWVDPDIYHPVAPWADYSAAISYLGTYAEDRHSSLNELFLKPALELPQLQFVVGGAMYPDVNAWPRNVRYFEHVSPADHARFYSSSPLTLNITRGSMAAMGYCPSGRLFEAAACGTAVVSDWWMGLDSFFEPGEEILIARSSHDMAEILRDGAKSIEPIARRARQRALDCHTAAIRAQRLVELIETAAESIKRESTDVGNHTGSGNGITYPTACVL